MLCVCRAPQGFAQLAPSGRWPVALPSKDARERVYARLNVAAFKAELAARALAEGRNAGTSRRRVLGVCRGVHAAGVLCCVALQLRRSTAFQAEAAECWEKCILQGRGRGDVPVLFMPEGIALYPHF